MKRGFKVTSVFLALFALGFPAGTPVGKPIGQLEGMHYLKARAMLIKMGWKPSAGNCQGSGASEAICREFPEIGYCSGVAPAPCALYFVRSSRCMVIGTRYGPPGPDAVITDVQFTPAPCPRN